MNNLAVTEKKNGSIRVCLDQRPLNKAIKREHHHILRPPDVQRKLAGKRLFTVVDMRDAFWHVKLSEESSYLCTFHTPWGRKWFGTSYACLLAYRQPVKFSNREMMTFSHIRNIIIAGKGEAEHNQALRQVMKQVRQSNAKFSFNGLGSRHTRMLPFFFSVTTRLFSQSVGLSTLAMIPMYFIN